MPIWIIIVGLVALVLAFSAIVGAVYVRLDDRIKKHGPSGPEGL